jgi:hypothetical protein
MDRAELLHFRRPPAETQYEALWRLALSGLTVAGESGNPGVAGAHWYSLS